jgi:formylglycine-generating enzyme required for sulfatase activity
MSSEWEKAASEKDSEIQLPGGIPMFFRRIPATSKEGFRMGSRGNDADEEPIHRVRVPHDFFLGKFVVTQEQYAAVASKVPALKKRADPSHFKGRRNPVERVDWREANRFCDWLTRNVPATHFPDGFNRFCLPTEAEWEYACRGGTETEYYSGDGESALAEVGWYGENSGATTHPEDQPVNGTPERHPAGLVGMHGNVWEWCHDEYKNGCYRRRVDGDVDPAWEQRRRDWISGLDSILKVPDHRSCVLRGGSWFCDARYCRSAYRIRWRPDDRSDDVGFRVCLVRGPAPEGGAREQNKPAEAARGSGVGDRGTRSETDDAGGAGADAGDAWVNARFSGAAVRDVLRDPDPAPAPMGVPGPPPPKP